MGFFWSKKESVRILEAKIITDSFNLERPSASIYPTGSMLRCSQAGLVSFAAWYGNPLGGRR
jgi:hypothetical protein